MKLSNWQCNTITMVSWLIVLLFYVTISYGSPIQLEESSEVQTEFFNDVDLYSQYAAAAYCSQNTEKAGYKVACSTNHCPKVEQLNTQTILSISNKTYQSDVTGFVAVDITRNLIVLSFRGTESKRNAFVDLGYHLLPTSICTECQASHGFAMAWNDTRNSVLDIIRRVKMIGGQKKIVTVGHSLGGALAALAGAELRKEGYYTDMYLFGAPRFANNKLANWIMDTSPRLGRTFRITHLNDPVPQLPFTFLGHADIYPEYYISAPNNSTVKAGDIFMIKQAIEGKGNAAQDPKDLEAHKWYMHHISGCYTGQWLGGPDPTETDIENMIRSWASGTAQWMVQKAGELLLEKPLTWLTSLIIRDVDETSL